jgi:hypothetical protein
VRKPVRDERTLYALVSQAYELKDTPYFRDAVAAIEEWYATRHERDMWRRMELVSLLRDSQDNGGWKSAANEQW